MKKTTAFILILSTSLLLSACSAEDTVSKEQYNEVVSQNESLEKQISNLNSQLEEITQKTLIPQLKAEAATVITAIDGIGEVTLDKEPIINTIQEQYLSLIHI